MLDKRKIRLMSKLAVYDAKYGRIDRKNGRFFKWDYIYFKNFWTRAGVLFGCLIITLFYIMNKILVEQTDILSIDYKLEATRIGFYTVVALIIYTFIGTAVAKSEYKRSKERFEAYLMMLDKLDELSKRSKARLNNTPTEPHVQQDRRYMPDNADGLAVNRALEPEEQEYNQRMREYYRQKDAQPNVQQENSSAASGYYSQAQQPGNASKERESRSRKIDALLKFREAGKRNGNTDR